MLKLNSLWAIELEQGWSPLATHPLSRHDLPFRMLSSLVDAGQFHDVGINFPAVWIDEEFVDLLPKGVLVAQCTPVPRERPAQHFDTMEVAECTC